MKLYIIRHGESEANVGGYAAGWAPVSLTEKGFSDAKNIRRCRIYPKDLTICIPQAFLPVLQSAEKIRS
jgi:bisphosphoglycerate-dependent phosphoglycerate mutase